MADRHSIIFTNLAGTARFRPRLLDRHSNLLRTRNLKYIVAMTTAAHRIERSNSVRPDSVYPAHFEQKVLFRFIYFCTSNLKCSLTGTSSLTFTFRVPG